MTGRIAYVTGCMRSGSTLLNRVLGAHPHAVNVGGLKWLQFATQGRKPCSCGARRTAECSFWSAVDDELGKHGRGIADLDLNADDAQRFGKDNRDLTNAIVAVANANFVVDSSRNTQRLRRLTRVEGLDVRTIHIYKDPRAHASSYKRKGRGAYRALQQYWRSNGSALLVAHKSTAHLRIAYSMFTQHPRESVAAIFAMLDVDHDDRLVRDLLATWGDATFHSFGGNRMKRETSSAIWTDESWRNRLTRFEVAIHSAAGWPVHHACRIGSISPADGNRAT